MLLLGLLLAAAPPSKYLGPKQMIALMESSPRKYEIGSEENVFTQWTQQNASLAWPRSSEPFHTPALEGGRVVELTHTKAEIDDLLSAVEPSFQAKDWAAAEKGYAEVVARFPTDYTARLYLGDAALFGGKPAVALKHYEKATTLDPADHKSWYYRGNALAELGKKKEAIAAWVKALAMRPGHEPMLQGLELKADRLGYRVKPRALFPYGRVAKTADGVKITTDPKRPHWFAWSLCKALWRGEPEHRRELTGSDSDRFSIEEEKECLGNLADVYDTRGRKESGKEEAVEQLLGAIKAKLFPGYVVYEVASRIDPHVYLRQTPELQKLVEAYVRDFVLVPK